ncbi:MAG TPA: M14 family metallopeptidase [Vicinamibacterales bacterium]|nr:M14 family metallopeptidase [Vicinamibacterales bacterium]
MHSLPITLIRPSRRRFATALLAGLVGWGGGGAVTGVAEPAGRRQPEAREFTIGSLRAAPGTRASGVIEVPAKGDGGTTIPVSLLHGARPGPVLALVAGTHGMEYVPIVALQRLRRTIDPATLRGTIVMVHVANMPSFLGRTIYYSPVDGKNLNRVFPGSLDGTLSERIAGVLTREVIARADVVIDLHCGDGNEWLRPYTYWIATGDPEVARRSRELALAFGLERIVVDRERPTDPQASIYLSNTAVLRGKPALTTETGGLARVDEASIALVERGVAGVLRHLGMRDEGPPPVTSPVWIERNVVLRAGATGVLHPLVEAGGRVETNALVARITDFHGELLEEIRAPFAGEVLYVVATPPITKGEPVAMIGSTAQ